MHVNNVLHIEICLSVDAYCREGFNARKFQNLRDMILTLGFDDCTRFTAGLEAFEAGLSHCEDVSKRQMAILELRKDLEDRKAELTNNYEAISPHLMTSRIKEGAA